MRPGPNMASAATTTGPGAAKAARDIQEGSPTWAAKKHTRAFPATGMSIYYSAGSTKTPNTTRDQPASPANQSHDRKKPGSLTYRSSMSSVADNRGRVDRRSSSVSDSTTASKSGITQERRNQTSLSDNKPAGSPSNRTRVNQMTRQGSPSHVSPRNGSSRLSSNRSTPFGTPSSGSTRSTVSSCSSYNVQGDADLHQITSKFRSGVSITNDKERDKTFSPTGKSNERNDVTTGHNGISDHNGHKAERAGMSSVQKEAVKSPHVSPGQQGLLLGNQSRTATTVVRQTADGADASGQVRSDKVTSSSSPDIPSPGHDVTRGPVAIHNQTRVGGARRGDTNTDCVLGADGDTILHTDSHTSTLTHHAAGNTRDTLHLQDKQGEDKITGSVHDTGSVDKLAQVSSTGSKQRETSVVNRGADRSLRADRTDKTQLTDSSDTSDNMSTRRRPLPIPPSDPMDADMVVPEPHIEPQPMYENYTPCPPPLPPHEPTHNGYSHGMNGSGGGMMPVMVHICPEPPGHNGYGAIDPHCHAHTNGYAADRYTNTGTGFDTHTPTYTGASSDISDSLDSEGSSLNLESGFRFHMDQLTDSPPMDPRLGTSPGGADHPFLVGQRDIMNPQEVKETKIMSSKGTVRGLKNLVRAGIATFAEKHDGIKNYRHSEAGRVVVYTTSVKIVRETFDRCVKVKKILQTHMIKFDERDIFMSREHQKELHERLGPNKDVPQIFADGQFIGGLEEMEAMNESGELRNVFRQFKRLCRHTSCSNCGGYQYLPCTICHGSKKSQNRNYFMEEFYALRCTHCDENGLVRCEVCTNGEVITS